MVESGSVAGGSDKGPDARYLRPVIHSCTLSKAEPQSLKFDSLVIFFILIFSIYQWTTS